MRKILPLFLLLSVVNGIAQKRAQARIDSLMTELPRASDADKITIYTQLMTTYNAFDREAALKLEKPAMDLAEKTGLQSIAVGDVKIAVGRIHWRERNFDTALKLHNEAREIFEAANDKSRIALANRYLGQDHADNGNYPQALEYFQIALPMYDELGDKRNMAYVYSLFAWVYDKQGDYLNASKASYKELTLFEELGAYNEVAITASAVADFNIHLGNYEEALKLFQQSEQVYITNNDFLNLGYNHILIGKVQRLMGNYAESRNSYTSALLIGQKYNDITITATSFEGLANAYLLQGNTDVALINYLSASELAFKANNKIDLARIYCSIGECYRRTKQFDLSRKHYNDAFRLSKEIKSKTLLTDYYKGIERLDSTLGNWKAAYFNHKDFMFHRDSIFNQENISKMAQLQLQHQFERKETEAQLVQQEKDIRQQRQFLFLSIIALLVFILAIVLYRNQKRVDKINHELELKSARLEEENREKTSILRIVSHDLRSPFNKIKGLTDLLQSEEALSEKDRNLYFTYIQTSINQGNYLIQHLLDAQAIDHTPSAPSCQVIDITKFVQEFQQVTQKQIQGKQQLLQTIIEPKMNSTISIDTHILTRILDNLISNASKFSALGKSIYLRIWSDANQIHFAVRDEGPGISEEDQKKLFRKFQKLSAQPTAGENSTGLGLSITKALVEKINGTILVNSSLGHGTEMIVAIPVS